MLYLFPALSVEIYGRMCYFGEKGIKFFSIHIFLLQNEYIQICKVQLDETDTAGLSGRLDFTEIF